MHLVDLKTNNQKVPPNCSPLSSVLLHKRGQDCVGVRLILSLQSHQELGVRPECT